MASVEGNDDYDYKYNVFVLEWSQRGDRGDSENVNPLLRISSNPLRKSWQRNGLILIAGRTRKHSTRGLGSNRDRRLNLGFPTEPRELEIPRRSVPRPGTRLRDRVVVIIAPCVERGVNAPSTSAILRPWSGNEIKSYASGCVAVGLRCFEVGVGFGRAQGSIIATGD